MQLLGKSNRSTVQRLLLTCFVICIAVFLRTWQFSDIPSTPYIDEVAMLVDAKALVATGSDMHGNHWLQALFPSYGDYKLPLYIWFASLFSAVLGPSAFTIRLPSLLAGLLTLLLAGVLLWNIVSVSYARRKSSFLAYLSALVVVGLSPWAIQFSRTGFEAHVGQLFLGVSLYFLFVSKKRWEYYLLSALVAAEICLGASVSGLLSFTAWSFFKTSGSEQNGDCFSNTKRCITVSAFWNPTAAYAQVISLRRQYAVQVEHSFGASKHRANC